MFKNHRGSVLIATIWILNILAIFAIYIAYSVNQRALVAGRIGDDENLHFIAEAGIKSALLELKAGSAITAFPILGQGCVNNPAAFNNIRVGKGAFSVSYEKKGRDPGTAEARYGFRDEEGKININTAPAPIISRLLQAAAGLSAALAEKTAYAIIDYRDADTATKDGTPEDFAYPGVFMKNGNFEFIEEIKLAPGMSEEIFGKIKDCITCYGQGPVNINTASPEILEILGLSSALVGKVLLFRSGKDGIDGTADDLAVDTINNYMNTICSFIKFSPEEKSELEGFILSGLVTTRSSNVRIVSTATLTGKKRAVDIECIYDAVNQKIRYWKETARTG